MLLMAWMRLTRFAPVLCVSALVMAGGAAAPRAESGAKPNHLLGQSSPYLEQHLYNPVDWYPWGDQALARARAEEKPIFLSIGYSACHWCHVMEREAFSDPEVARFLNEHFVSIKVDREERPDLDELYMTAVVAMTGRGGWPMSVFLAPDRKPFHGGTYYPTDAFLKLIRSIADAWTSRRSEVLASAGAIGTMLADLQHPAAPASGDGGGASPLEKAAEGWKADFDSKNGGFGGAPKFPPHGGLSVLLETSRAGRDARALDMVVRTLDAMARGGIYDQIGGGFHRYSTDEKWLVPHFEKMLYDNALLVPVYLEAWKATGRKDFLAVAEQTLAWAAREMTHPDGGFYATLDADSEGEEGRFYMWSRAEIEKVVGPEDGPLVAEYLGAGGAGDAAGGRRILHIATPTAEFAKSRGLSVEALGARVEAARRRLLAARDRRPRPRRDDKVLAGWNGLMISACARAYRLTGDRTYLDQGERAARFVLGHLVKEDRLRISWRQGKTGPPGLLDDHAFLARGLLDLAEAGGNATWRERAAALVRAADRFLDRERGGYFLAAEDQDDLLVRPKGLTDSALPSGNAIMAECLVRLWRTNGDKALLQRASRLFALAAPAIASSPTAYSYMVLAARLQDASGFPEARAAGRGTPGTVPLIPEALAATRTAVPAAAPEEPAMQAPGAAPGAAVAGADRTVPGTVVGRASPERVVASTLTVPDRPVRPGQAITLSLRLDIKAGWHINSNTPSLEYLIPTKVEFPEPGSVLVDQVVYPEARLVTLKFADTKLSVYEGAGTVRATIRPPRDRAPGESKARARLTYQACSDTTCLAPETVEFLVPLRVEGEPVPQSDMRPAGAAQAAGAAAGGDGSSAGGLGSGGGVAAVLAERGLLALLGLVFLGGLALNLTPCIYPMMPVTIGFFATQARSSWPARIGLPALYVVGMAVTYSVLGVAAGLSGGLIGSTLQSPWVVGGLVILFVVLALSMFGLFELRLPGSITRFGGGRRGPVGALLMGLTMGLVAAPCIGPFIVGLLAYVGASGDPVLGFWLFFVMAIGMGLPNLVLGVFSGSLAALPRSGEWLIYAKKVMGIGMLAVAIYFVQPLLKDRVVGWIAVGFAILAGLYLGFLERTRLESRLFPAVKALIGLAVVAGGISLSMPLLSAREEPSWEVYSHEAFARASKTGRPILIDFYADWCLPCRELDRFTFSDPAVLEETRRFVLLKADLTQFESRQVGEIRDRFDVLGVPTLVFLDGQGVEHKDLRLYGFEEAGAFVARLRQVR
jgi:hypothetical protein